ncbi:putative chaperone (SurA domain) [Campylobacter blaseri]|uniref:Uncharacterized protein n=1 Tax=Campylobacter blaseri TaxID=2042961 RepID=A0A2P8R402_9BACT|nr:peptidylprolyl isomerase [Campylobacter blaseri]PSM53244.1 hypothetical protein CQ405_01495 [Campylobacter blaseri]PSM54710.1 hypothetical protein CRN67_01495 [Campylobacter blaseri]QKF86806.1 putative chaperone (SurA domain) [Campylobacter blaseri]
MKKKFILITLFSFTLSYANIVNWVVALVNNEPITNYELVSTMEKVRVDKKTALELLIKDKLKTSELKKRGIVVSPFEIDNQIKQIAEKNGKSVNALKEDLSRQGIKFENFEQDVAKNLKEQKFFAAIFEKADKKITPENIRDFYEQNKRLFTTFDAVNVTRFASDNKADILRISKGGSIGNTFNHKITIKKSQLDPNSQFVFMSIPNGGFTPIIPNPRGFYEVFRIDSKSGYKTLSFEEVKDDVTNQYIIQVRKKNIEEYFEKLRAQAVIEFLEPKK